MRAFYWPVPCKFSVCRSARDAETRRPEGARRQPRYAIYLELVRSPQPRTTAEIAETLALHPNTVRPHLERMRDVGLLHIDVETRGEVGRPQHRYSLAADAPSLGLEPPSTTLLSNMLLRLVELAGIRGSEAAEIGRAKAPPTPTATRTHRVRSKRW